MRTAIDYLTAHWSMIAIPAAVFAVSMIALFWLRKMALDRLRRWTEKLKWQADNFLIQAVRGSSFLLCLIFSLYLGLVVSSTPAAWKNPINNGLWTLFVFALTLSLLSLVRTLALYYGRRLNLPNSAILITRNVVRVVILIVAVLIVLDIWGVPTSPVLLLIAVIILVAIVAFRDAVPNLFASFQIASTREYKAGDYIRLDSNEEGYITDINWHSTRLKALDGSIILIPNNQLIHHKVVNYGRPLKKAKEPFYFNTRTHLAELTGLKARNLRELADTLKKVPNEVIYYHTHHFLEEHQYLIPELSNDFAIWVKDAVGNSALAERLASVNTFEFTNLGSLRDRFVNIIEECQEKESFQRQALEGREFYFIKSVIVILPTYYAAHDLREFIEALRKVSPSSLYFHIFESGLRLEKGSNDFSIWLKASLDEEGLSHEISRIDPYDHTLEGLRSTLIQVIEKHIK
jgi:small-conductance mechanosensitive channel